jgi:seryl-tRNA synthetase
MIHQSVPIGKDDSSNKEIKKWGKIPEFDFKVNDHIDISEKLGLVDLERAAKVAGARFYYMKNDLVRLNQALIQYALDFLSEKNYSLIQPPYMINRQSMEGAVIAEDFEDVIYKIEGEDLYMIGTSEHAIAAMHSGEIIDGKELPLRYAGSSPCFRKEAGAHGRDQKGIFRVHQFDKIEQFVFTRPEDSWNEHERMLEIVEKFYQNLEIPYRVMLLSSGDMGKISAKTYDLEAWMAGQNAYREIVSCSNCLDFQARRLKIRYREKTNEETQYLHTLNSTLVATSRVLVSIMENFQNKDGQISIPDVLQKYMGQKTI